MKSRFAVGLVLAASCTVALAATPSVENEARLKGEQFCNAASGAAATEAAVSSASGAAIVGDRGKPSIDPNQPVVQDGGSCPFEDSCSCGVQVINFDDPACIPGVDLGITHCHSLHCPSGQTVHMRTCPCEASGCVDTWSTLFCAAP